MAHISHRTRNNTVVLTVIVALLATLLAAIPAQAADNPPGTLAGLAPAAFLERYAQVDGNPGDHNFTDVPAGAFYDGDVGFLADREITTGTSANTSAPNDTVTRGQMATFLWRLANEPNVGELSVNCHNPDVTIIADQDDANFTVLDAGNTSTLERTGADKPPVGQILAFDISDETPDGFLGKVTAASGETVTTAPATIAEAIRKGDFDILVSLDEDPAQSSQGLSVQSVIDEAMQDARLECEDETEVWVEAPLTIEPSMTLEASWGTVNGARFRAGLEIEMTPELRGRAAGKVECSASVSADGPKLRARLDLHSYDVVGLYLTIGPFLEITAQFDDPW
ncbi:MAG: hypothetical protein ACI9C1_003401 [Candidatus Aldehydirespiratoraceae bacterium]|jgi:hypothetical protein